MQELIWPTKLNIIKDAPAHLINTLCTGVLYDFEEGKDLSEGGGSKSYKVMDLKTWGRIGFIGTENRQQ